jgi:hypothetical protein
MDLKEKRVTIQTGLGPVVGSFKHGNRPSGPISGSKLLDHLSDY